MVSRLLPLTIRPIQTRFRFGCETLHLLTLPEKVTRRFIMQKARSHSPRAAPTACRQTGSGSIALLCSRFFSPFPHGTGSLSVSREYLALRDGPRRFGQDFTCPDLLRISLGFTKDSCTGLSPSMALFPAGSTSFASCHIAILQPHMMPKHLWFGLLRVRSPLLTQSLLFSLPMGT